MTKPASSNPDIFICCAEEDIVFADAIRDALETRGTRCWFASLDNPSGSFSMLRKGKAIARCTAFALFFSVHTNTCRHAECETSFARKSGKPIVAIRLDNYPPQGRFEHLLSGVRNICPFEGAPDAFLSDVVAILSSSDVAFQSSVGADDFPLTLVAQEKLAGVSGLSPFQWNYYGVPLSLRASLRDAVLNPHVRFTMASPANLIPGAVHTLVVCVTSDDKRGKIVELARVLQNNPCPKPPAPTSAHTRRLPRVRIELSLPGIELLNDCDEIIWEGRPALAAFGLRAAAGILPGVREGQVTFYIASFVIAQLNFRLNITAQPGEIDGIAKRNQPIVAEQTQPFRSAFALFAREDEIAVLARVHELLRAMPDFDLCLGMHAKRDELRWPEHLKNGLQSRNVCYLFWSGAAQASEAVAHDWRLALECGAKNIFVVPLAASDNDTAPFDRRQVPENQELACVSVY